MASNRILRAVGEMTNFSKNYARSTDYPYKKKMQFDPSVTLYRRNSVLGVLKI